MLGESFALVIIFLNSSNTLRLSSLFVSLLSAIVVVVDISTMHSTLLIRNEMKQEKLSNQVKVAAK